MRALRFGLALCGVAWLVHAQTNLPPERAMSLQDCIQQALQYNLDLQIERYNPQVSMYNLRGSYAGYDPVFSFSGRHENSLSGGGFNSASGTATAATSLDANIFDSSLTGGLLPWGTKYDLIGNIGESYGTAAAGNLGATAPFDNTRGSARIVLSQPLLKNFWIDGTRLNISVAKNRLKYSEQGLRLKIMDIVRNVENAYYDLIAARENVKVQGKALQLAEQLLSENKKRVEVGTLAPLDEKQAESQVATARADVLFAKQTLASAQNVLKSLLTDNYQELHEMNLEPAESLTAPVEVLNVRDSWSKGMTQRPDLLQAKLDLEQQGIQLRYDRNQLFPQLDLIGSYGHSAGGVGISEFNQGFGQIQDGSQPSSSYGARLSIPLSNLAARNNHKARKLTLQQTLLNLKKLEQVILVEIDNSIIAARASYERVGSTHEARRYAEAALDAEQKKLQNGKSTSFVVLQLQKDLTSARSAEIRALADYNKALADLAHSEGTTLDRENVKVEVKK